MTRQASADLTGRVTADVVRLEAMRWWHVEDAARLEGELFGVAAAWSAETFWSELARPETRWYVAALRGEDLVGYAGLMTVPAPSGRTAEADVQTVAVAPSARGAGLGRQLLGALLTRAESCGAATVTLEVRSDNEAALALYRSAGFTSIAVRRGYYADPVAPADAVVMQRRGPATPTTPTTGTTETTGTTGGGAS